MTLTETKKQEAAALQAMIDPRASPSVEPTAEERAAMREVVFPGVRDWWLAQTGEKGAALLAAFEAEIGN